MKHGENYLTGELGEVQSTVHSAEAEAEHRRLERDAQNVPLDEEDALRTEFEEKRVADRWELYQMFAKTFEVQVSYQDNQSDPRMLRMSTRAMALAWQFRLAAGADGSAELARKCGILKKQTVEKCLNLFLEEKLRFPALPGQRDEQARAEMSRQRKSRVKAAARPRGFSAAVKPEIQKL